MRSFFVSFALAMMAISSFAQDSTLFSNNELFVNDIGSGAGYDLFVGDVASNPGHDLLGDDVASNVDNGLLVGGVDNLGFNIDESYLAEPFQNDFQISDTNFLTDKSDDCLSTPSPVSRVRARSGVCANNGRYIDVQTAEDVQKYWCSESSLVGFANIPVCNLYEGGLTPSTEDLLTYRPGPTLPFMPFTSLLICQLSKFSHIQRTMDLHPGKRPRGRIRDFRPLECSPYSKS